jgi:fluoride exporter
MHPLIAIAIGAILGAWSRYGLSLAFNGKGHWPMGTLFANAIGGLLVGFAIAFFAAKPNLDPNLKLFFITGFLGALTTFSTYSAEVIALMQQQLFASALGLALTHVVVSLALCAVGTFLAKSLFSM